MHRRKASWGTVLQKDEPGFSSRRDRRHEGSRCSSWARQDTRAEWTQSPKGVLPSRRPLVCRTGAIGAGDRQEERHQEAHHPAAVAARGAACSRAGPWEAAKRRHCTVLWRVAQGQTHANAHYSILVSPISRTTTDLALVNRPCAVSYTLPMQRNYSVASRDLLVFTSIDGYPRLGDH